MSANGLLEGKSVIVSGAGRGLGKAYAEALRDKGVKVLGFDLLESVHEIDGIESVVADISKREDVERVVAAAEEAFGGVDILVNNAGAWRVTLVDSPWEQAVEDWDFIMDTNLRGLLMLSRVCVPIMQRNGGGDIVNISTYYVLPARSDGTNNPQTDLYCASKWALNGFTDAWSKSLAKDNIRVNAMCMGATDTPMLRGLFPDKQLPPEMAAEVMSAEDIAQQMIDLINDGRTGENIGAWVGYPIELGPRKHAHKRITG